jgi:DNA invertase Pin-like site-specific DNA recombinase
MEPFMRVAIYARVSTEDKGQNPENQLRELRAWCAHAGHTISREYVERESGRKGADKRKQFAALFEDAAKRKFDCLLFWALDRFSREGMAQTIAHLQRLNSYGVTFHSYTEPHLATDNELVRNILLALLSSLAKVEAQKISERTKSGMARAKAKGIKIGRPRVPIEIRQQIVRRAAKGEKPFTIAKVLGIDRHTAAKYARGRRDTRASQLRNGCEQATRPTEGQGNQWSKPNGGGIGEAVMIDRLRFYRGFLPTTMWSASWLGMAALASSLVATTPSALSAANSASAAAENSVAWSANTWMLTADHPCCPMFGFPSIVYTVINGPPGWPYATHVHPAFSSMAAICDINTTASGSEGITAISKRVFAKGRSLSANDDIWTNENTLGCLSFSSSNCVSVIKVFETASSAN